MKLISAWPIWAGLCINILEYLWRSNQEGLGLNLNVRYEFSAGYLVSGMLCLNAVLSSRLEFGLRTGCTYRLPCVG